MKLDGMRRYGADEVVDAVVIGTGAGGAPLLARLAAAGLRVVALEAGRNWSPGEEFATDEIAASSLYWLGERLSAGETPTAFGPNNSGTGVGGSTLHWGAYVPRVDARDLAIRTEFGVGMDWPFGLDELRPYYERVEQYLGVSGPESYPWDAERRYPLPPVALNGPAQVMQYGCAEIGVRTSEAPIAAVSRTYQVTATAEMGGYAERHGCVNRGYCHQGCRNGAKASMDVTYLPAAVAMGAEIRPNCTVHGFERDGAGRITGVAHCRTEAHGTADALARADGGGAGGNGAAGSGRGVNALQRCRAVFVCAGAIETPRLLLHAGVANGNGQVGRNFMAHVATQVWGTFEQEMRPNKGFPASLITEDMIRPKGVKFAGGYLVQPLGIVPITWSIQVARGRGLWGEPLVDYLQRYNHVAGIGINGDCLPDARNFLELSDEVDAHGVPKPRVHFSYGKNETAMSEHADKMMRSVWAAAGARDVWTFQRSAHTVGTCRMGKDAESSVVNEAGRSHEIPNLWISDNSTFPSALPANPALTIMALSLRTADRFLAEG